MSKRCSAVLLLVLLPKQLSEAQLLVSSAEHRVHRLGESMIDRPWLPWLVRIESMPRNFIAEMSLSLLEKTDTKNDSNIMVILRQDRTTTEESKADIADFLIRPINQTCNKMRPQQNCIVII